MFDIHLKEHRGDQVVYVIRDDPEHTKIFPTMFAELDENRDKYRIKTFGLSNSSLEQVFLRVADEVKSIEEYERASCWQKLKNRMKISVNWKDENQQVDENPSVDGEKNVNVRRASMIEILFFLSIRQMDESIK